MFQTKKRAARNNNRRKPQSKAGSEHNEQSKVIRWLEERGLLYLAIPNSQKLINSVGLPTHRKIKYWQMLKEEGFKPGAPDILIYNSPIDPSYKDQSDVKPMVQLKTAGKGIALEMKRLPTKTLEAHKVCNCMDPDQIIWKEKLERQGWVHVLAHGWEDAINQLSEYYPDLLDIG